MSEFKSAGGANRWFRRRGPSLRGRTVAAVFGAIATPAIVGAALASGATAWWSPGSGRTMPKFSTYENAQGRLAIFNADGPIETKGHPFFEPVGSNGRACVTCHQPSDGMSLSAKTVQERWNATGGRDPLFAAVDGSNCPALPQKDAASHSLLLTKGLFRVSLAWPPRATDGTPIDPEFSIEVVSDPTGCNTSPVYGLSAPSPRISIFRRSRMAANLKYVEPPKPLGLWQVRTGQLLDVDPETKARLANNLMADGRAATLRTQMGDAMNNHQEAHEIVSRASFDRIRAFEMQVYTAQVFDRNAGSLQEGGASMGPVALAEGKPAVLGGFPVRPMFPELEGWRTRRTLAAMTMRPTIRQPALPEARPGERNEPARQRAFRDSVARGYTIFMYRPFLIRDTSLNALIGNPIKQACVSCHDMQGSGLDNAPGHLGLGTSNFPTATPAPDLPLFRITCRADAPGHPFLGRTIYTSDPGRALITGKCSDIGAITLQQLRALSARAPYFANGSAKTLRDVVEFYDRRFHIAYTEQEKQDLVNFLGVL